jgi:hypothetical protein
MADDSLSNKLESLLRDYGLKIDGVSIDPRGSAKTAPAARPRPPAEPPAESEQASPAPLKPREPAPAPLRILPGPAAPKPSLRTVEPENPELPADGGRLPSRQGGAGMRGPVLASAIAAAFLIAVAAGGMLLWPRHQPPPAPAPTHRSFALPREKLFGLVLKEGILYAASAEDQLLEKIDPATGRVLGSEKFWNPSPAGLAWGDGFFWSSDRETGYIYRHKNDASKAPERVYMKLKGKPSTLYYDGGELWAANTLDDEADRYAVGPGPRYDLTIKARYPLRGAIPAGLYFSGGHLWVLDALTRRLIRYDTREGRKPRKIDSAELDGYLPLRSEAAGLALDTEKGVLWLLAQNPSVLQRFALDALFKK